MCSGIILLSIRALSQQTSHLCTRGADVPFLAFKPTPFQWCVHHECVEGQGYQEAGKTQGEATPTRSNTPYFRAI